jgi:hypothetical protein
MAALRVRRAGASYATPRAGAYVAFFAAVMPCMSDSSSSYYCTPEVLSRYGGWPRLLDWGIYWFGPGDQTEKAMPGKQSIFYDPLKPTLIFFHGWTGEHDGTTRSCKRMTTQCSEDVCPQMERQLLAERWFESGWNVGFFYWDQFADEECARDAEQKIWFDRKGDGLRWKSFDVGTGTTEYHEYTEDVTSIADLCVKAMEEGLGNYAGPGVRFVGHSVGAQLAVRCAGRLHMDRHVAAPTRLTLLEPYFTKHHFGLFRCHKMDTGSGIGSFTAEATTQYVKNLWEKSSVVTEVYKSSLLTEDLGKIGELPGAQSMISEMGQFGEPNTDLEKVAALVEYSPFWCGGGGPLSGYSRFSKLLAQGSELAGRVGHVRCQHLAAFPIYLLGIGRSPPALDPPVTPEMASLAAPGSALLACTTPSASCTDGQIREWIERQLKLGGVQRWVQFGGRETFDNSDDTFNIEPSLAQEARVVQLAVMPLRVQAPWWQLDAVPGGWLGVGLSSLLVLAFLGIGIRLGTKCSRLRLKEEDTGSDMEIGD